MILGALTQKEFGHKPVSLGTSVLSPKILAAGCLVELMNGRSPFLGVMPVQFVGKCTVLSL